MRYSFDHYDSHGYLKAPLMLWLGWFFLARAWVVFAVAGVSRESGSRILQWVYPDNHTLYLGLLIGIPSVGLMWMMGLRKPDRHWVDKITQKGRAATLALIAVQLLQTLYHVYLEHGQFHWANALTLLLLLWFGIYLLNSKWVKDCFSVPKLPNQGENH
ncbi:hypothetical protein BOO91_13025 [Vibrio navarrensis]|uniref:DUF2919 domain-containing protein n=1 Tax=Vibrio navarrensis TaxID=29495 RepID=A0AAJ4LVV1_9VIBR|nr:MULTISPECIES: DUF2919 domain-containing protein [Vibrio]KJR30129.1 membrane protein [Vibrio sp. S234-5]MBE3657050.1 hypothetical protein [Vibrio navarrensis]MBE3661853.1 hypothetical protein [Vibrio navarrensis]MBE4604909.1 hypothetical protein [Vibrio navarrensis]QPL55251.1 DUF2919 domain-containing protein [Vibrio navarrensis]